jgi:hypothetical protein
MCSRKDRLRFQVWLITLGLVLLACLAGAWYISSHPSGPVTVSEYEQWIDTSLPPGTPKWEVESWLKSHHIPYGYKVAGKTVGPKNVIEAVTGTAWRQITIYFFFDDQDRVTKRMVTKFDYSF